MKYKTKQIVIEAFQWFEDTKLPDWVQDKCTPSFYYDALIFDMVYLLRINTLEDIIEVSEGDYIVKGINGKVYPCKPDIFEQTYEKVAKP